MADITKRDLQQYRSMRKEIAYLQRQLATGPEMVSDSVVGSMQEHPYAEAVISIRGVDTQKRDRQRERLAELLGKCEVVDRFIDEIASSGMRMYLTLRFIEGQSWIQVASNMGNDMAPERVRKAVERYLDRVI